MENRFHFLKRMLGLPLAAVAVGAIKAMPEATLGGGQGAVGRLAATAEHGMPLARHFDVWAGGIDKAGKMVWRQLDFGVSAEEFGGASTNEVRTAVRFMTDRVRVGAQVFDRFELRHPTTGRTVFQAAMEEGKIPAGWPGIEPEGWLRFTPAEGTGSLPKI